jgi:hypothetical protein
MNKATKKTIANTIRADINDGIYARHTKLREKLSYIATKLIASCYVVNAGKLTIGELKTLKDNNYINEVY